jgi:hypothetical protein
MGKITTDSRTDVKTMGVHQFQTHRPEPDNPEECQREAKAAQELIKDFPVSEKFRKRGEGWSGRPKPGQGLAQNGKCKELAASHP